tara:strand:- start:399 stop:794 length:396 start_codon:yes stop_codon:yes gene_type:complete
MSTLSVATIKSPTSAAPVFQNSSGTQKGMLVGAWVSFDGSSGGTNKTIYDSYNVSSVADNGSGRYTVNFTNSFANGNYCVAGSHNSISDGVACVNQDGANNSGASQFSILTTLYNGAANPTAVRVVFIGDM